MIKNIQGRLKKEFPYYSCFPATTNLIAGLHTIHASKSTANVVVILKDTF